MGLNAVDFGHDFTWGVSSSAYQTEGASREDGKGPSIWDVFTSIPNRIPMGHNGDRATEFYHRYIQDLIMMQFMGIRNFRFSLSWSRIMPEGTGKKNEKGIEFYDRLIDFCLHSNIRPWVTLYHWDLPDALERKGGWANRDVVQWFLDYVSCCLQQFGDRVKDWMVLNEPVVFTGAGYFLGLHAPGKKGLNHFLPAVHHAALCQSLGGKLIRSFDGTLNIGTTISSSPIDPADDTGLSADAAQRVDVLTNRLFIEPLLGAGYPWKDLKVLQQLEKYMVQEDEKNMAFNMDFIGLQNYTREVVRYSAVMPYINARRVKAGKRNVSCTAMDWEIYPAGIYRVLKRFGAYAGMPKIIITENGAAFDDRVIEGRVHDPERIEFFHAYLKQVLRARMEDVNVEGYFAWSFTDNFEWAEGFRPRFGLVYVDYSTQKRIIKDSGFWYKRFIETGYEQVHARAV